MTGLLADGGAVLHEPAGEVLPFSEIGFHPHPEVLLITAALVGGYWWAITRLGPRHAPSGRPAISSGQKWLLGAAIGLLFLWASWPLHDISEDLLFSVHMTQHTFFSLIIPPLLLLGTPAWLQRLVLARRGVLPVVRRLSKPLLAALVFNAVVVLTHIPRVVDWVTPNELLHFAAHVVLFSAAMFMWLPVVNTLPELPRLSYPMKGLYLFLQGIIPTVPASFLTFADKPLYSLYERVPRLWGMGVIEDQQLAGAIMKVGGTTILWGCIVAIFYRWYTKDERDRVADVLLWEDVEREFERAPAPVESR